MDKLVKYNFWVNYPFNKHPQDLLFFSLTKCLWGASFMLSTLKPNETYPSIMPVRSHDAAVQTQSHISFCWWVKVFFMKNAVAVFLRLPSWALWTRLPFDSGSSFWSVSLFCFSDFTFVLLITIFFPPWISTLLFTVSLCSSVDFCLSLLFIIIIAF